MKRWGMTGILVLAALHIAGLHGASGEEGLCDAHGQVTLLAQPGGPPVNDASMVVVWLVPLDRAKTVNTMPPAKPGTYQMLQRDKKFAPELLVVPIGSQVAFPNGDPWFHNVFSLYRGKRFDLGLYQAGATKSVEFNRLGASYIFCNIHPQMSAVILTVDSPYFGVTDKEGRISISGVPVGRYRMRVWYKDADPAALEALGHDITVGGHEQPLPSVYIQIVPHDLRIHKNKYGEDYDTGPLVPNY